MFLKGRKHNCRTIGWWLWVLSGILWKRDSNDKWPIRGRESRSLLYCFFLWTLINWNCIFIERRRRKNWNFLFKQGKSSCFLGRFLLLQKQRIQKQDVLVMCTTQRTVCAMQSDSCADYKYGYRVKRKMWTQPRAGCIKKANRWSLFVT